MNTRLYSLFATVQGRAINKIREVDVKNLEKSTGRL